MQRQRMKDLLLRVRVVVKLNVKNESSTSSVERQNIASKSVQHVQHVQHDSIFPHSTNQIIDLWRCRCPSNFLNFLMAVKRSWAQYKIPKDKAARLTPFQVN